MKSPLLCTSVISLLISAGIFPIASAGDDSAHIIKLPQPTTDGATSLEKALRERRSVRQYKELPLPLSDLSQLLWAAQGVTASGGRRTAPSAGALYPLDAYVVAGNVTGLPPGIYLYQPHDHAIRTIAAGDVRTELSQAALGQASIRNAPAVIVLCAVYERTMGKYGERGIRYVHMEAGHSAQNVSLQAAVLGLGTVVVGAFHDDQVGTIMHLPKGEAPLSLLPIGKR